VLKFSTDTFVMTNILSIIDIKLTTSDKEIRHFNLYKSSDSSIIYARVLDAKLPSFTENVSLVLHYKQAFLDLLDDWEDIEEDVKEDMPNVFVMDS